MTTQSLLLFKPDAAEISIVCTNNTYPLHVIGCALLNAVGLEVTGSVSTQLAAEEVQQIYEKALVPNPKEDAIYGTEWKNKVVQHMSSGQIEAYFVKDNSGDAEHKAKIVKNFLRRSFSCQGEVVKNIAHVPDADEYSIVEGILLNNE